ncbi:hypothetical protein HK101_009168 [Irineochytrium annulatum]|nr:hypothetical protein HK101_009168 [Irineochytrium annulatum]
MMVHENIWIKSFARLLMISVAVAEAALTLTEASRRVYVGNEVIITLGIALGGSYAFCWLHVVFTILLIMAIAFARMFFADYTSYQCVIVSTLYLSAMAIGLNKSYSDIRRKRFRHLRSKLIEYQSNVMESKKAEGDALLSSCLPTKLIPVLRMIDEAPDLDYSNLSQRFERCSCLFVEVLLTEEYNFGLQDDGDVSSRRRRLNESVQRMNAVFDMMDRVLLAHPTVEKIKTIGQKILFCSGLMETMEAAAVSNGKVGRANTNPAGKVGRADTSCPANDKNDDTAPRLIRLALDFRKWFDMADGRVTLRMGLYSGPIVAGLIGRQNISFDVIGDCINCASRMQALAGPSEILTSETVKSACAAAGENFTFLEIGVREVKGKGRMNIFSINPVPPPICSIRSTENIAKALASVHDTNGEKQIRAVAYQAMAKASEGGPMIRTENTPSFMDVDVVDVVDEGITIPAEVKTIVRSLLVSELLQYRFINLMVASFQFGRQMMLALTQTVLLTAGIYGSTLALIDCGAIFAYMYPVSYALGIAEGVVVLAMVAWVVTARKAARRLKRVSAIEADPPAKPGFDLSGMQTAIYVMLTISNTAAIALLLTQGEISAYINFEGSWLTAWMFCLFSADTISFPVVLWSGAIMWNAVELFEMIYGYSTLSLLGLQTIHTLIIWANLAPALFLYSWLTWKRSYIMMLIALQQKADWEQECQRNERVLNTLFPKRIVTAVNSLHAYFEYHEKACVLSTDIVGYTSLSSSANPVVVIELLNLMFTRFDDLCSQFMVEKVTTIGDGFLAFSSIFDARAGADSPEDDVPLSATSAKTGLEAVENLKRLRRQMAFNICILALKIQKDVLPEVNAVFGGDFEAPIMVRAGVHAGELSGSIWGGSRRFKFEIGGSTVEGADKVQQACLPGQVCVSEDVMQLMTEFDFISKRYEPPPAVGLGRMKLYQIRLP